MDDRMEKEIEKWKKRTLKKGPLYLYKVEPFDKGYAKGDEYTIIFKEKGKVKIGTLQDEMWCRYGVRTFGTLSSGDVMGLWQSSVGVVDKSQLEAMIEVWNDESKLEEFDIERIKGLRH